MRRARTERPAVELVLVGPWRTRRRGRRVRGPKRRNASRPLRRGVIARAHRAASARLPAREARRPVRRPSASRKGPVGSERAWKADIGTPDAGKGVEKITSPKRRKNHDTVRYVNHVSHDARRPNGRSRMSQLLELLCLPILAEGDDRPSARQAMTRPRCRRYPPARGLQHDDSGCARRRRPPQ